jgi:hypothetical protein
MHLLVILLQQLLGLLPNKQQAQPEPARVRSAPPQSCGDRASEQQAFQSSYAAEQLRTRATIFSRSTASARPNSASLRDWAALRAGNGLDRPDATPVAGTLPAEPSDSSASPISQGSAPISPESHS